MPSGPAISTTTPDPAGPSLDPSEGPATPKPPSLTAEARAEWEVGPADFPPPASLHRVSWVGRQRAGRPVLSAVARGIGTSDEREGVSSSVWQKSSFSAANNECVEVRVRGEVVELRESDEPGTTIGADPAAFRYLLKSIKAGGFDRLAWPRRPLARPERGASNQYGEGWRAQSSLAEVQLLGFE
ncbi:DUF397 domain-containing protein [Streptomyces sp. NRRL S-495]|uniref:DUF397 domain-containing protein n=1 Tax=Streptomyces sp. NRRL S-495 TaxID=1609133 RepID=UPI00099B289F|nr:DUF397 domain-containing protein [Streptomyces sp. NRRL S-495]